MKSEDFIDYNGKFIDRYFEPFFKPHYVLATENGQYFHYDGICDFLEIEPKERIKFAFSNQKDFIKLSEPGSDKKVLLIREMAIFDLMLRSNVEMAKDFKRINKKVISHVMKDKAFMTKHFKFHS
jgi:prophage antirepressor-like protein